MKNQNRLEIEPKNAKPSGFQAVLMYAMIIIGLPSFFVGGFILVILGILILFVFPNKIKKEQPVSFILTHDKLSSYTYGRQEKWSIPWEDIEEISIISLHWAAPKNIGISLKRYTNYQKSLNRSSTGSFFKVLNKIFNNTAVMRIGKIKFKCDIIIPYQQIDRSANEFANLLCTYWYKY